jgi:hypothetical protein
MSAYDPKRTLAQHHRSRDKHEQGRVAEIPVVRGQNVAAGARRTMGLSGHFNDI